MNSDAAKQGKTEGNPTAVVSDVRNAVLSLDTEQPIYDIKTLDQRRQYVVPEFAATTSSLITIENY